MRANGRPVSRRSNFLSCPPPTHLPTIALLLPSEHNMPTLLDPITLGDLNLRNRVIMAPLTRSRAVDRRIPNDLMAEYYAQRASAGMILSEATAVSPTGVGYANTPGIWS